MQHYRSVSGFTRALLVLLAFSLAGCATLPSSGPTKGDISHYSRQDGDKGIPYTVVPLDAAVARELAKDDGDQSNHLVALSGDAIPERSDIIRRGDTLQIALFEIGVSLFAPGQLATSGLQSPDSVKSPTAAAQNFPVAVRENGTIDLPYLGTFDAAGRTPEDLAALIRSRLHPLSEHPDVAVSIADSLRNVVYVSGAVSRPGRYRLSAGHEHLLDALALAGGSPLDVNDLQVTLVRADKSATAPLNQIGAADKANLRLLPGDRISLERARRSYTVFGATDRVNQVPFDARSISLAEAIARAGGPSDYKANPRGVFLFRYEHAPDGSVRAMVYQVNMLDPQTYFVAQVVPMHDKDVVVFANASSNFAQKLFGLLANLFNPFVAVRTATQ